MSLDSYENIRGFLNWIAGFLSDHEAPREAEHLLDAIGLLDEMVKRKSELMPCDVCAGWYCRLRDFVDCQAEDEGLWFMAETASEAYLQQGLRKLHEIIEEGEAKDE